MEKNQLKHTAGLVIGVLCLLLALYYLPDLEMGGHRLRKVDLLAEVRPVEAMMESDTLLDSLPVVRPVFVDTCRAGLTCIEDYSDSACWGMGGGR